MNKVILMILDGWGINPETKGNAVKEAKTPHLDKLLAETPNSTLKTSGLDVGLPDGIMGNSEVGHMNIGAGRVVYQLNTMIDKQIETGKFFENKTLKKAIALARERRTKLHLFTLLSDGNVHSNLGHLYAMMQLCAEQGFSNVYLHAFMDGRDTLPNSGLGFMEKYIEKSEELGLGKVATISGRYYAMDRDKRWDRIKLAYDAIVRGKGEEYEDPLEAIRESYENKITDEFIIPKVIKEKGEPTAVISDDDVVIFLNYRADRARQITRTLIEPGFSEFEIEKRDNLHFVSMSEYDINFSDYLEVAFYTPKLTNILGEVLAANNIPQLRLAETEKYAHVTFFFNCGREEPYDLEDRVLIPSPKIASYDLQPEMSAFEVKDALKTALNEDKYPLIVVNFANCDMVGHTGVFDAAVKAVETVDRCVGETLPEIEKNGYNLFLTADHGNAEKLLDENDNVFTAHTTNPVPILIKMNSKHIQKYKVREGRLADIAPTILSILEVSIPKEMDGKCLVSRQ